ERMLAATCIPMPTPDETPQDDRSDVEAEVEVEVEVKEPAPALSAAAEPEPEAPAAVERPVAAVPVVARAPGVVPPSAMATARTAAHRSASAPMNRFQQGAAKAEARKAARAAAKGHSR